MLQNVHNFTVQDYQRSDGSRIQDDRLQEIVEEDLLDHKLLLHDGNHLKNDFLNHRDNLQNAFYPHQQYHNQQGNNLRSSLSRQTKDIADNVNTNQYLQNCQYVNVPQPPARHLASQHSKDNTFQAVQSLYNYPASQAHTLSSDLACEKENNGYIPNLPSQINYFPYPAKPAPLINQSNNSNNNNQKLNQLPVSNDQSTQILTEMHCESLPDLKQYDQTIDQQEQCQQYQYLATNSAAFVLDSPQLLAYEPDTTPVHLRFKEEIIQHLLQTEENHQSRGCYIGTVQKEINERMRGILLDWLVEVHFKLKLQTETLFMAVNLIDRYLERINLDSSRLQLLGITALFVASKYEEVYAVPHVSDLVYVCDNAFTDSDIFTMEGSLLLTLDFNILSVSSFRLLDFFMQFQRDISDKNYFLARYLLEIALLEYKLISNRPSLIAAAAIYLVNKIRKLPVSWNQSLERISGYSETAVRPCAKQICNILQSVESRKYLASLRKKFSKSQFFEVARIKIEHKKEYSVSSNSGRSCLNHGYLQQTHEEENVINTTNQLNRQPTEEGRSRGQKITKKKHFEQNGEENIQNNQRNCKQHSQEEEEQEEESIQTLTDKPSNSQLNNNHHHPTESSNSSLEKTQQINSNEADNQRSNEELLESIEYLDVTVGVEAARVLIEKAEESIKDVNITRRINQSLLLNQLYLHGVGFVELKIKSEVIVGLLAKKLGSTSIKQLWQLPAQLAKIVINSMFQQDQTDILSFVSPQFHAVLLESLLQGQKIQNPCY